jgi:hypothetical protein
VRFAEEDADIIAVDICEQADIRDIRQLNTVVDNGLAALGPLRLRARQRRNRSTLQ